MSKKDSAETRPIVTIVGGMPERHIADYIERMLEAANLTGNFQLKITQKVKGSGFHHGVETKRTEYNAVMLLVQSSDNGTRYKCYLKSSEMKPRHLMDWLMTKFPLGRFDATAHLSRSAKQVKGTSVVESVGQAQGDQTASPAVVSPAPSVSFAGRSEDDESVAMILMAIRFRFGMDSFGTDAFLEAIQQEYAPGAAKRTTSQLLRRIVSGGYIAREGDGPKKLYHLAPKGIELLTTHDRSTIEIAAKALNLADANEMAGKIAELEPKARKHAAIAQEVIDLGKQIDRAASRIEELEREARGLIAEREELQKRALAAKRALEDPELKQAMVLYQEVQKLLKR